MSTPSLSSMKQMQGDSKKQSRKRDPEDLVRQVAHLKSRMGNLQKDIRRLEYDNALLQRKLQTLTSIKKVDNVVIRGFSD